MASITNVLSDHLGGHRARLTFMARFIGSVLTLRTTDLWRIAASLKASVQTASNHRRIQRFLASYDLDAVQLERLLVHLAQVSPPYLITVDRITVDRITVDRITVDRITVDRTESHVGTEPVNVLAAGISLDGETCASDRVGGAAQRRLL